MKEITAEEFRTEGYLSEVNRLVLHPLGLAMYVDPQKDKMGVFDMRDDPEGVYFGEDPGDWKRNATHVFQLAENRRSARLKALGYWIQVP